MDRRSFLRKASVGGATAAATTTLAAPLYAQGNRTLKMVTSWSRGLAGTHDAAQRVADNIDAMSDGQLKIELIAANEMVGAFEVFDAVSSGQADIYNSADYYYVDKHPAFGFFTSVPFGMTAQELFNWYHHGGGLALHHELAAKFNLKPFLAANTGVQAGGWFKEEIGGPEDFNGLSFRMPGLGGRALAKLGADVQNIPGGQVYEALAQGKIDGTEWLGPWADEKAGFQEITKTYYTAGFHEPGSAFSLTFNLDVFESLTPAQKKIAEVAANDTHIWSFSQFMNENGAALRRLRNSGVKIREFPNSVWNAFGYASAEVHQENLGDEMYKKIYDSYYDSMQSSSGWISISEGQYRAQRDRVFTA